MKDAISKLSLDQMADELFKITSPSGKIYFSEKPDLRFWNEEMLDLAESQLISVCYDGILGSDLPTAYNGLFFDAGKFSADYFFSDEDPKRAIAGCIMLVFGWTE